MLINQRTGRLLTKVDRACGIIGDLHKERHGRRRLLFRLSDELLKLAIGILRQCFPDLPFLDLALMAHFRALGIPHGLLSRFLCLLRNCQRCIPFRSQP